MKNFSQPESDLEATIATWPANFIIQDICKEYILLWSKLIINILQEVHQVHEFLLLTHCSTVQTNVNEDDFKGINSLKTLSNMLSQFTSYS